MPELNMDGGNRTLYILGYLNTLGQTKQFPVQISEFVHTSEEVNDN